MSKKKGPKRPFRYYGIDGEGQDDYTWPNADGTRPRGAHRYKMLMCSSEDGSDVFMRQASDADGAELRTQECLDMLLELPSKRTRIFAYSFNYDLTMMLKDLDEASLYYLFRPDQRQRKVRQELGPWPVMWPDPREGPYALNLQGTKFSVKHKLTGKRVVIWDLFRFFGTKFVNALKAWGIGSPEEIARMSKMKDKRSEFDKEDSANVRAYCLSECRAIAALGHKLVRSHDEAGLTLKSFYGAGSSGAAMLDAMGAKEKNVKSWPEDMIEPVAQAFVGGRFENGVIGPIRTHVYGWDISSAYPYQIYKLPCLEHGTWERTYDRSAIDGADVRAALVEYKLPRSTKHPIKFWGPFPFRDAKGNVCFPASSPGGWVWRDEYLAGERLYPRNVQFTSAWVYRTTCGCKPFAQAAEYYLLRLKLGKEGAGIVIKLGLNSGYGKLAQSVGNAPFNNWVWAGIITSGCRAQMLDMIRLHKDKSKVLMIATDGLYTTECISAPQPEHTGTNVSYDNKKKPLGGWELKNYAGGMFAARPGIYFPMFPTDDQLADVRARGVGKAVVLQYWDRMVEHFERYGIERTLLLPSTTRFCGAKTSISRSGTKKAGYTYKRASGKPGSGKPSYGQWIERRVDMSFNPLPKREGLAEPTELDETRGRLLTLRHIGGKHQSAAYKKAMPKHVEARGIVAGISEEAMQIIAGMLEVMEQPDMDFLEGWEEAL
jgi:hypothetical protein